MASPPTPPSNPLDAFKDPLAGGLTGLVLDIAQKVGGAFIDVVKDRRQAQAALQRYETRYRTRYGSVRILGMKQDYPLEQVYTKVKFLDELSIRRFESLENIEDDYRSGIRRRFNSQERLPQDGTAVINTHQYLTVLGQPGAGKSTFLRRVGLEAFRGKHADPEYFQHECIPVFLELKRFNPQQIDLLAAIAQELSNFGFPSTPQFAEKALEQGKLLVLLDGLDEVPKELLNPAIEAIQDFVTRYSQNRFITSCRTAAHRSDFRGFVNVELADFDDGQIQTFIENWFQSPLDQEAGTAQRCCQQLNDERNAAAKELAQTPLLLTFLCLVYNRTQKFFDKRATLYRKALDILLEEWAADKRLPIGELYDGFNTELEKVMLAEIAYNGFVHDQLFFTRQELVDQINAFIENTADKPTLPGKDILNAIAEQQGIFVERAEDIYSFSHLTLQEYLTAHYIAQDSELIKQIVDHHLTEHRWREVLVLMPGLLRNADGYLWHMQMIAQRGLTTPKLRALMQWADDATAESDGNYNPAAKRAAAIFLVLDRARARALALDLALDRALAIKKIKIFKSVDFSHLIDQLEILKSDIPNNNQPIAVRRAFADKIRSLWSSALHLDPETAQLSKEESQALDTYLSTNHFILECKAAAVRVSKDVWEKIEARMLTLWDDDQETR
jgi:hypothetical protein